MAGRITSYRDLDAWREAIDLATACYRISGGFPAQERYGLTQQIRRAAVSVPSNIAEGHRRTRPAFLSHLRIASGSLAEIETQLELSIRLGFVAPEGATDIESRLAATGRLVYGLIRSLGERP